MCRPTIFDFLKEGDNFKMKPLLNRKRGLMIGKDVEMSIHSCLLEVSLDL
jgi:hypothetical protein